MTNTRRGVGAGAGRNIILLIILFGVSSFFLAQSLLKSPLWGRRPPPAAAPQEFGSALGRITDSSSAKETAVPAIDAAPAPSVDTSLSSKTRYVTESRKVEKDEESSSSLSSCTTASTSSSTSQGNYEPFLDSLSTVLPKNYTPYHKYWNYTTHRLELPEDANNDATKSSHHPRTRTTSFDILEKIIHQSEEENKEMMSQCFQANLTRSYELIKKYDTKYYQCRRPSTFYENQRKDLVRVGDDPKVSPGGLSYPILNLGFPKSGTSSLFGYFQCAGYKPISFHAPVGHCMHAMVDSSMTSPDSSPKARGTCQSKLRKKIQMQIDVNCYFPQMTMLDEFHLLEPNATFVLLHRPVDDWIHSATNWNGMTKRWNYCRNERQYLPSLVHTSNTTTNDDEDHTIFRKGQPVSYDDLTMWWCRHMTHVREFVKRHPSHELVELDIYDTNSTTDILTQLFGGNSSCWGQKNAKTSSTMEPKK